LLPSFVVLLVFAFYPVLFTLYMSFHQWKIIGTPQFIGLQNFLEVLESQEFQVALRNTLIYSLVTVPVGVVLALSSALLLNQRLRARAFFRGVIFFPVLVPTVVIALIWVWMFSENYGIVNRLLEELGRQPRSWLANPTTALIVIMVMSIWKGFGYGMVIYLAGLQTIPATVFEAAVIDGASAWQRFWRVTLPLLNPTTLFVTVISFIGSFQVFDQVYVMTEGGPGYSTTVLVHYIYDLAYVRFRMGKACSAACILFLIILLFTWLQLRFIRPQTEEGP
jgi:ABC-type sugar transport system permease subunit